VVKAMTSANNLFSASACSAQIKPAELCKLPLLACCLCFVLSSTYLRHSGPEYPRKVYRLWLLGSGCLGTL
jgi:hypothetical protein